MNQGPLDLQSNALPLSYIPTTVIGKQLSYFNKQSNVMYSLKHNLKDRTHSLGVREFPRLNPRRVYLKPYIKG